MSDAILEPIEQSAEQLTPKKVYISAEEYLEQYADQHYEWIDGEIIEMSPITLSHEQLLTYLKQLFLGYFEMNSIGLAIGDPFVMQLDVIPSRRQPDLQIILGENLKKLTTTAMIGAANICIEIVSDASVESDYAIKFDEYEKGGVKEYWIIDPFRHVARFNRLNDVGVYESQSVYKQSAYKTPLLPYFAIQTDILWITPHYQTL